MDHCATENLFTMRGAVFNNSHYFTPLNIKDFFSGYDNFYQFVIQTEVIFSRSHKIKA